MIPRLFIWVPGTIEQANAGLAGWLPALAPGSEWDQRQWRLQYRARGQCTAWIKVNETHAA